MRKFLIVTASSLFLLGHAVAEDFDLGIGNDDIESKVQKVEESAPPKSLTDMKLREYLVYIAKKNKGFHILSAPDMSVWAIDKHTTVIYLNTGTRPGGIGQPWFAKAMRKYCKAHGQKLVYKIEKKDPISGEKIAKYYPVKERKILGLRSDGGFNDLAYHNGFKCDNVFEVQTMVGNFHYHGGNVFASGTLVAVFKTPEEQPLTYFISHIKDPSKLQYPKTDDFGVAKLKGAKSTYQVLYALCEKNGGSFSSFIRDIKNSENCYEPTENVQAFRFIGNKEKQIILACDNGEKSFIARYVTPNFFFKFANLKDSGIDICKTPNSAAINKTSSKPNFALSIEDQIALRASDGGEIFKKSGAYTYRATYNGRDGSCSLVSVIRRTDGFKTVDIFNYKICNGQIVKKEMTGVEKVPSDVKALIPQVAKMAQLHGRAEMDANGGFRVIANAVRDERKCNVEVKILRGILLIKDEIVNACNY